MTENNQQTTLLKRQVRLAGAIQAAGLDAAVFNPGPTLSYLTGLSFHLSERPVIVFFCPTQEPVIVLPELETAKLRELPYPVRSFAYGEDPGHWGDILPEGSRGGEHRQEEGRRGTAAAARAGTAPVRGGCAGCPVLVCRRQPGFVKNVQRRW